jgi:hypothetical protein
LISKDERYLYNPNNEKFQLALPLSAKECFRLYYGDLVDNFYMQFKTTQLLQKEIVMTRYEPRPP